MFDHMSRPQMSLWLDGWCDWYDDVSIRFVADAEAGYLEWIYNSDTYATHTHSPNKHIKSEN